MSGPIAAGTADLLLVAGPGPWRDRLAAALAAASLRIAVAGSGAEALERLAGAPAAAMLLVDWRLPDGDGLDLLRRLRATGAEVPVFLVTDPSDSVDEAAALALGEVDFIGRAHSVELFVRRLATALHRLRGEGGEPLTSASIRCGRLELRPDSGRAFWDGRRVGLTLTEFEIVHLLAEQAGRDVSYRRLYDVVHGTGFLAGDGSQGYRVNVRSFVKRIRQKFRAIDPSFDAISNYPGFGYRWRASR